MLNRMKYQGRNVPPWGKNWSKVLIPCITFYLCLAGIIVMTNGTCAATTYYVDATSGSDFNDGLSEATPWKTAWKIVGRDMFSPGDVILFKRGEVWHEQIWLNSSGSESAPLVIDAYGDPSAPLPLFDGTYQGIIEWEQVTGTTNIYRTVRPLWVSNPNLLFLGNTVQPPTTTLAIDPGTPVDFLKTGDVLLLRSPYNTFHVTAVDLDNNTVSGISKSSTWPGSSLIDVRQLDDSGEEHVYASALRTGSQGGLIVTPKSLSAPGQWYWDPSQQAVFLYSAVDPNEISVKIAQAENFDRNLKSGFVANKIHDVTVRNLAFSGFSETGMNFSFGNRIIVENCSVSYTGIGGHKTAILLNTTHDSIIRNCMVKYALGNGIGIYAQSPDFDYYNSNNNIVEYNTVTDTGAAGITLSTDLDSQRVNLSNNIIRSNTVERANSHFYDAAGIYLYCVGEDNLIDSNTVRYCGTSSLRSAGIMLDSRVDSVVVKNNLVSNNRWYGIAASGYGHQIINNTIKYNSLAPGLRGQIVFFNSLGNASACTVVGNTVISNEYQYLVAVTGTGPYEPHIFADNIYEIVTDETQNLPKIFYWIPSSLDFTGWKQVSGDTSSPPVILSSEDAEASQESIDWVQKCYIAYYGRPADPAGLDYWARRLDSVNGNLSEIIQAFGTSEEFNNFYGGYSSSKLIDMIYEQMFGRMPDVEGKDFYMAKLSKGEMTLQSITLQILSGACGDDLDIIQKKLEAAEYFTARLNTLNRKYYSIDEARAILDEVNISTNIATIQNQIDSLLSSWPINDP